MKFRYTCVECKNVPELEHIIEREVTHDTFRRNIGKALYDQLIEKLGYHPDFLSIKDDWHVTYHKSKTTFGKIVYYLRHSAIEYVYY